MIDTLILLPQHDLTFEKRWVRVDNTNVPVFQFSIFDKKKGRHLYHEEMKEILKGAFE